MIGLQPAQFVPGQILGRQDQNRNMRGGRIAPNGLQHSETIHIRHHQIKHHPVRMRRLQKIKGLLTALDYKDCIAFLLQNGADLYPGRGIVFHHQNRARPFRPSGRQVLFSCFSILCLFTKMDRQLQGKYRSLSGPAVRCQAATEHPGRSGGNGQTESRPVIFSGGGAVHLPELIKNKGQLIRLDPDSGILNRNLQFPFLHAQAHRHPALLSEFHGIADQVLQDLMQPTFIILDLQSKFG